MRYGLGHSAPRVEDDRLLRGRGRYTDDLDLPGQAWAGIVRSPHAHARIVDVGTAVAAQAPGVLGVFTASDLTAEGVGSLPNLLARGPFTRPDGSPAYTPPRPPLASAKAAFAGEPVALVVAESAAEAKDAAEQVTVDYEALAALPDVAAASAPGAPALWEACPDNLSFRVRLGDHEAVAAALGKAAHVVRTRLPISRVCAAPMEPRAALGAYDPFDGRYTLYEGTQSPHALRTCLAESVLGVPETRVRVVSPDMGGSFGLRGTLFPESVLVLWAARRLGRPVKWSGERSEGFLGDDQAREMIMQVEIGLDEQARFLALRVHCLAALGAYLTHYGGYPAFVNLGGLAGPYRTPAICAQVDALFTTTPPVGPYRGAGRPEATLAIEHAVDQAARTLGLDRAELRRRNLIAPEQMPFQTGLRYRYDCGEFERVLDRALAGADPAGFEARRARSRAAGKLRGLGIALSVEQAAGISDESAELRFEPDGTATVILGTHSHGQGHETVFRQLVADRLGLAFEQIRYVQGDTDKVAYGGGTGGSRCAALGGGALHRAVERVIEKGRRVAAHQLEAADEDLEFDRGSFVVGGTDRRLGLQEVVTTCFDPARRPPEEDAGLSALASFTPSAPTFPNGCHLCEVEVDPETGTVAVERYHAVEDTGTVMNPMLLRAQLQGGIVQGFGQIVQERVVFDAQGQPLSGSFMDYAMPRADEAPFCEIALHPVPTAVNPLGIKGAGEAGTVGAMASVLSAVHDALASAGVHDGLEMPASPERVWRALRRAGATGR